MHQITAVIIDDTETKALPPAPCNVKENRQKSASLNQIMSLPSLLEHQLHLTKEYLSRLTQVDSEEVSRGCAINLKRGAAA